MAESVSLAVHENLVHMRREDFPEGYVLAIATVPSEIVILAEEDLRKQWGNLDRKHLGDRWIDSLSSAVLAVRSTVVPFEHNYLLNPQHPDFAAISVEPAIPFLFDERLFGPG